MKCCPLHKNTYCEGSDCALAGDKDGNCLIHKLLVQLTKANEPISSYDEVPEFTEFNPPGCVGVAPFSKLVKEQDK